MELNKKNRTELKAFFQANNIPTQQHFEQFIDAGINQAEDGIIRISGNPLAIQAEGETVGTQEILNLFSDFDQNIPDWSFNLNPRIDPQEPGSNQPGFNIKDATGQSRLFIQSGDGSIGVGTIEPESKLTVQGTGNGSLIAAVSDTEQHSRIFEITQEESNGILSLRGGDTTLATRLSGAIATPSFFLGRVGLGTQTPQAPLSISGPGEDGAPDTSMHITSQSILFGGSNAGGNSDSGKILLDDSSLKIYGKTSGTNTATRRIDIYGDGGLNIYGNITANDHMEIRKDLTVTTGGSIGIGIESPAEKLHVLGGKIKIEGTAHTYLSVKETGSNAESRFWTHTDGELYIQNSNGIHFAGISNASRYVSMLSNGNVGIGNQSPSEKLEVAGNMLITSDGQSELRIISTGSPSVSWRTRLYMDRGHDFRSGGVWIDATADDGPIWFSGVPYQGNGYQIGYHSSQPEYKDSAKLFIQENGNVGVGIASPADRLDVRGTLRLSTSNNHARMYVGSLSGRGTGLVFEIKSSNHGSNRKIIWNGDNNWDSPSDESLKSNITEEKNILERLVQLDVKNYNWKDTYNQKNAEPIIGFIAQEVKPLFPSLVGEVEDEDTKKKLMTLKYASFGVLAVGAIKELRAEKDAEITKHRQLIDELKTKVEKLGQQLV